MTLPTINIFNVPKAIMYFIIGIVAVYVTWEVVPFIIEILLATGLSPEFSEIAQIIWFGILILSVIFMLGYPVWCLFDTEDSSQ